MLITGYACDRIMADVYPFIFTLPISSGFVVPSGIKREDHNVVIFFSSFKADINGSEKVIFFCRAKWFGVSAKTPLEIVQSLPDLFVTAVSSKDADNKIFWANEKYSIDPSLLKKLRASDLDPYWFSPDSDSISVPVLFDEHASHLSMVTAEEDLLKELSLDGTYFLAEPSVVTKGKDVSEIVQSVGELFLGRVMEKIVTRIPTGIVFSSLIRTIMADAGLVPRRITMEQSIQELLEITGVDDE